MVANEAIWDPYLQDLIVIISLLYTEPELW